MKTDYDVIVIGAGPAGITAAMYLKRAKINCAIIEKGAPGGALNKTSLIENYPGYSSISGPDLAMNFFKSVQELKIPVLFGDVTNIVNEKDYKIIETKDKKYTTKKIIIAVGRAPISFNNESKDLEGKGISYCSLCDGYLFKNEDVAIIGGGNTALEEALYLSEICNKVYIIHRRDELRGDKILVDRIKNKDNIEICYSSEVEKFNSVDEKLESLDLKTLDGIKNIKVKACFIFIGYEPATKFLKGLDILDEKGYIITSKEGRTTSDGIYACGDVVEKPAYQIVTATGDAAIAAVSCIKDLS